MSSEGVGSFHSFDHVPIVFDEWNRSAGGPPVVLHHGFAADAHTNWVTPGVVAHLLPLGRWLVALDARGHGRSGKPHDPAAYAGGAMVRDVGALLDHLGVETCDLVGYSMGAIVALTAATHADDLGSRVRSLVLGGIGASVLGPPSFDRAIVADALEADDASGIADAPAKAFRRFAESTGADRLALAAVMRAHGDRPVGVGTLRLPTLVVVGAEDGAAADAAALADAIPGALLRTVPGDHLTAVAQPGFADAIAAFLATVSAE